MSLVAGFAPRAFVRIERGVRSKIGASRALLVTENGNSIWPAQLGAYRPLDVRRFSARLALLNASDCRTLAANMAHR